MIFFSLLIQESRLSTNSLHPACMLPPPAFPSGPATPDAQGLLSRSRSPVSLSSFRSSIGVSENSSMLGKAANKV